MGAESGESSGVVSMGVRPSPPGVGVGIRLWSTHPDGCSPKRRKSPAMERQEMENWIFGLLAVAAALVLVVAAVLVLFLANFERLSKEDRRFPS